MLNWGQNLNLNYVSEYVPNIEEKNYPNFQVKI